MKSSTAILALAALFSSASAKEIAANAELKAQLYDSGVRHEQILKLKNVTITMQSNSNGS